jgi:hypothetical protein
MSENLGIVDVSYVGREKNHLSLRLYAGGKHYKAIYFGGAERGKELDLGDKIDLAYTVKKNEFNGKVYVDLVVKDFRPMEI